MNELNMSKKFLLGIAAVATLSVPFVAGMTAQAQTTSAAAASSAGKIELIEGKRVRLSFQNVEVRGLLKATRGGCTSEHARQ